MAGEGDKRKVGGWDYYNFLREESEQERERER